MLIGLGDDPEAVEQLFNDAGTVGGIGQRHAHVPIAHNGPLKIEIDLREVERVGDFHHDAGLCRLLRCHWPFNESVSR